MTRVLEEVNLLRLVDRAVSDSVREVFDGASDDDVADARRMVRARIDAWLERQADSPDLVGVTVVSRIFGISKSGVARLRERGVIGDPWLVDGGFPAWPRAEILEAREALAERRAARNGQSNEEGAEDG